MRPFDSADIEAARTILLARYDTAMHCIEGEAQMKNEQWRARYVLVYAAAVAIALASAQTFPSKPVRIVVGVPPGGTNDTAARTLAVPLSAALGQSVIVEN